MISSHVKRSPLLWLHNDSHLSQPLSKETRFWNGIYIIGIYGGPYRTSTIFFSIAKNPSCKFSKLDNSDFCGFWKLDNSDFCAKNPSENL